MAQTYAFRFYGADPSEWEGESCSYEVHFRAAPSEAERVAIAREFETTLVGTTVDSHGHDLRWAADWALFAVEPRRLGTDFDWGMFFKHIRSAFEAVNRVAPLEEIVFLELIDLTGTGTETGRSWHSWSVAQQAIPGDAPTWEIQGPWLKSLFSAKQRRFTAPSIVDPAAEAARREVQEAVVRKAEETKAVAIAAARIVFETRSATPPLPAHVHSRALWRRAGMGFCETRAPEGSWLYALRGGEPKNGSSSKKASKRASKGGGKEQDALWELFLGDDKQLKRFEPTLQARDFRWAYGTTSLFLWDGSAIHQADLGTRQVRRWMPFETPVRAMAALAGALAVLTEKELVVYDLGDPPREAVRIRVAGKGAIDSLLEGRVLSVHADAVWGDPTILLAYQDGKFWLLGAAHERLELVWEVGGAVFAERSDDQGYFEIVNLEAACGDAMTRSPDRALDLAASEGIYSSAPPEVGLSIEIVEDEG